MNAQERLISDGEISVAVFGNGLDFVLIPLDSTPSTGLLQLAAAHD